MWLYSLAPGRLESLVLTETRPPSAATTPDVNDVWTYGCPKRTTREPPIACRVESGSLHDDLWSMVSSDVFVMAKSSLSFTAAYLRLADNKLTLVTIPRQHLTPSSYWMFWSPDDAERPQHIYFLNASTDDQALQAMESWSQLEATRDWLIQGLDALRPLRRCHRHFTPYLATS